MKSKKLISFLCALAMTVSSFAGLAVTASAATDVFTYTDGATTGWAAWNGGTAPGLTQAKDTTDETDTYLLADAGSAGGERIVAYTLPSAAQLTDNYVIEFDSYIQGSNGMGRESQVTQIVFAGANAAQDTRSGYSDGNTGEGVGKGYILKLDTRKTYEAQGIIVNDPADTIPEDWTAETNYVEGVQNQWTRTQAVVSGGKVTVKMIDANGRTLIDNVQYDYDGTTLSSIVIGCGRGDSSYGGGKVSLDNVHIYSGAAEALSETGIKGAKTYITVPADASAKKRINKTDAPLIGEDNFNGVATQGTGGRIIGSTTTATAEKSEFTDLNVVNLEIPNQSDERSSTDYWQLKINSESDPTLGTDKIITAQNGVGSTANRGPRMYFKRSGNLFNVLTGEYVIAEFATRLHAGTSAPAEVIFSGDLVASESKGNLASPLAMITTDAEANSGVYAVEHPLTKGSANVLQVNDNEWVFVTIYAYRATDKTTTAKIAVTRNYGTDDAVTTYIFGEEGDDNSGYATVVDNTGHGVNNLPYITFRSGNDADYGVSGSSNDIDNVKLFSTLGTEATPEPTAVPTPTPVPKHAVTIAKDGTVSTDETTAFDAVLVHTKYDATTNAPTSVKTYPLTGISATTPQKPATIDPAIAAGDKLFVWSDMSGIVPYGSLTVPDKTNISSTATITIPATGTVGTAITPTVTATGLTDDDFTYAWYKGDTAINVTTKAYTPDSAGTYKVVATVKDTNEDYTGEITSGNCVVTVPTYTVTGTLGTGVASAVLRPEGATDATTDVAGTVDDTTVTYTVPAGTYTVVATVASGYKTPVADPTTVTVDKDHTTASFNTSATKIVTVSGTVDAGVTAVKLTEKQEAGATEDPVVYNGVINNGAVTFSDIAAGTYTIDVTLKDGYKDAVIKLGTEDATEVTVAAADITNLAVTSTDSALYRENTSTATTGTISASLAASDFADTKAVTAEEVAKGDVPDYGTATAKQAAVPALDGWGYKHFANSNMDKNGAFQAGRQSNASVDAATNTVFANGVGNAGCDASIVFIPANKDITLPTTGTIVYSFDAVITKTASTNTAPGNAIYGVTTANDGADAKAEKRIAGAAIASSAKDSTDTVTKPVVIKYNTTNKLWTVTVDGELQASGVTDGVKGIYAQAPVAYVGAGIKDLVISTEDGGANAILLGTVAETDGTIAVDKYIAEAGEKITITATPAAGKKVTAVTATPQGGDAITATAVEGQANKYEFTVPAGNDKDITVTATFGVADAATVTVAGGANAVTKGQSTPAFTATVKSADNTDITASKTVTWAVVGVPAEEGGTAPAVAEGTAVANGVLTVAAGETNTKLKVTATVDGVTGESGEITVSSTPTATVTVGTLSNGTVTINGDSDTTSTVDQGSTITLTVTPATGYSIGTVSYVTASALEADPDAAGTTITPASDVYSFTMPNENVTVKATFTQNSYTITNNTGDAETAHGSVTVAASAHYNEEVTVTVTPAEGYELATLKYAGTATAETAITKDAESGAYKFTMPAENVTVTATFKVEVMEYTGATLLHTASATWGSNNAQTAKDQAKEHLNNDSGTGWAGSAFMQFTLPEMTAAEAAAIVYAPVTFSLFQGKGYDVAIYYLKSNPDWSADGAIPAQNADSRYTSSRTYLTTVKSPAANTNGTFTIDIAKAINEMGATGTVTLMLTGNNGGSDLYGKASTDPAAPVLGTLKKGRTVTFTSSVTDEDFDVVVTGDNIVGNKTVTVTGGTGSVTLPEGSYNYSVEAQNGYKAIASTALTVAKTPVTQPLNLELIPLSDVTFASNATNFTVVVKKGETTVEPKEAGGKVYSLVQGEEYTYTVTPTGADAAAYDPKTATYTVTADATQTVTATLDAKTYSVTLTGLPQYAKVSYKVGDAADATDVYTDASGTLAAITGVPANGVITYTVQKGGYTTITDATTSAITADTNVPVTMTPTVTGTMFYEDFANTGLADDARTLFGNQRFKGGVMQIFGDQQVSLSGITGKDSYTISFKVTSNGSTNPGTRSRAKTIGFKDSAGNILFQFGASITGGATDKDKITIGSTPTELTTNITSNTTLTATVTGTSVTVSDGTNTLATGTLPDGGGTNVATMYMTGNGDTYLTVAVTDISIIGTTNP